MNLSILFLTKQLSFQMRPYNVIVPLRRFIGHFIFFFRLGWSCDRKYWMWKNNTRWSRELLNVEGRTNRYGAIFMVNWPKFRHSDRAVSYRVQTVKAQWSMRVLRGVMNFSTFHRGREAGEGEKKIHCPEDVRQFHSYLYDRSLPASVLRFFFLSALWCLLHCPRRYSTSRSRVFPVHSLCGICRLRRAAQFRSNSESSQLAPYKSIHESYIRQTSGTLDDLFESEKKIVRIKFLTWNNVEGSIASKLYCRQY